MPARSLALVLACAWCTAGATPTMYFTTDLPVPAEEEWHASKRPGLTARVREVANRANVNYTIRQYPWTRAYAVALSRRDACVFATSRTPEREEHFKWVGPLYVRTWVLVGRAGQDYQVRTLEDARKYRIGTFAGDAAHEYLRSRGFQVDAAQSDNSNPQKLLLGRIDLWASANAETGPEYGAYYPHAIVPVLKFNTVGLYLACNKAVPDAVVTRLNTAAASMLRDLGRAGSREGVPPDRRTRRPPCLLPGHPEVVTKACD
jgi:polar amino acid transport system substrate-binding protein